MRIRQFEIRHVVIRRVQHLPRPGPARITLQQLPVHGLHQRIILRVPRHPAAPQDLRHPLHPLSVLARPFLLRLDLSAPVNAPRGTRHDLDVVVGTLSASSLGHDGLNIAEPVRVGEAQNLPAVHLAAGIALHCRRKSRPASNVFYLFYFFME